MRKRIIPIVLTVLLLSAFALTLGCTKGELPVPTEAPKATEPPRLSDMTEEECRAFLSGHGIEIPAEIAKDLKVKELFMQLEEDPERQYFLSAFDIEDFIEDVRLLVKEYYGIKDD